MSRLVLNGARTAADRCCRIVIEDGMLLEVRADVPPGRLAGSVDVTGTTVLPGLWDHHTHLYSSAARAWSVDLAGVRDPDGFKAVLEAAVRANTGGWVRLVGYDDEALGELDSGRLERLVPTTVPVKVQHRSGHQWVLNRAAIHALAASGTPVGSDGLLWDTDEFLREKPGGREASAMADAVRAHARRLASYGCVGVTDMSVTSSEADITSLHGLLFGLLRLNAYGAPGCGLDAVKRIISDHNYPDPDDLTGWFTPSIGGRVAAHAVTAEALALVLSAGDSLGPHVRLEHAFMADDDLLSALSGTGVELGVQPGFIRTHGDRVLRTLPKTAHTEYQRLASMQRLGMAMFGGTDSPFAPESPWQCMESAVTRQTAAGQLVGDTEALSPEAAFALFTGQGLQGSAGVPRVEAGQWADLCFIDRSWPDARSGLANTQAVLTVSAGSVTWDGRQGLL